MPLTLWRIVKTRHAASAFDGEGARRFGGRWNPRGLPAVYLGGTLSLAALETLVHLTAADARLCFVALPLHVPDDIVITELPTTALPAHWRSEPPPPATQAIGGEWLKSGSGLLLKTPSVIIPAEANYLLNPLHPDFGRTRIGTPQPFGFDQRLWK
ncbi:MAG: RES family NAD+ phosphorylase [Rhodocyclaceae bacterium]|nr:RES family NAD+ phosphorylase [Rhodocyclaceae bacterium]